MGVKSRKNRDLSGRREWTKSKEKITQRGRVRGEDGFLHCELAPFELRVLQALRSK